MYILGIETSCDDTAAAVIEAKGGLSRPHFSVLANISYSQIAIHKKFGGIVPNLASRAHLEKIIPTIKEALKIANKKLENIDLIAVTNGPGLLPSLLIGVNTARALAYKWQKPIIGINHIEGHIFSNWLTNKKIEFPALILIVSGGHTELVLMKDYGKYKTIGQTLDDAAGETFDKTARLLGLEFPGGPAIAAEAAKYLDVRRPNDVGRPEIKLPRPMINSKDYNFSFSGLKTAVLYLHQSLTAQDRSSNIMRSMIADEIQNAIVDVLAAKTVKAIKNLNPKTVMIAGGVSANKALRERMAKESESCEIPFLMPEISFATDNAAMIAATGYFSAVGGSPEGGNNSSKNSWKNLAADANLKL